MKARPLSADQIPDTAMPRFWASVEQSAGCWLWKGWRDHAGYGVFKLRRQGFRATRVMYAVVKGAIPAGKIVCHTCDNPPCCNPDHLWLGTVADNSRDMVLKGRSSRRRGTANTRCVLTPDQVSAIRSDPRSSPKVAPEYGVTDATIRDIRTGRSWSNIR